MSPKDHPSPGALKRQARRKRFRRSALIILAIVVVIVAILALVRFVPIFTVSSIEVEGTQQVNPTEAIDRSGLHHGDNMVGLDTGAAASAVASLPWVKSASVSRHWPGSVSISIEEFTPAFHIKARDGYHMYDSAGKGFVIATEPLGGVPLTGIRPSDDEAIAAVGKIVAALPDGIRDGVREIHADNAYSVVVVMHDDRRVRWGSSDNLTAKVKAMELVLQREGHEWNISDPQQPSVK